MEVAMSQVKVEGSVKWFSDDKGFGFVQDEKGTDYFVHYSQIEAEAGAFRSLKEGQAVLFEAQEGPRGLFAVAVETLPQRETIQLGGTR